VFAIDHKCVRCEQKYPLDAKAVICSKCEGLLEIEYDYDSMQENLKKKDLGKHDEGGLWRYAKALPIRDESIISLGEGLTPLVTTKKLNVSAELMVKLDYVAPTSSFKDRGSTVAISKANELRVNSVAIDSTENAAASVSAYAARAGIPCYAFIPSYTGPEKAVQISNTGAIVIKVKGTRQDCHDLAEAAYRKFGW
jgi:threonine synthase